MVCNDMVNKRRFSVEMFTCKSQSISPRSALRAFREVTIAQGLTAVVVWLLCLCLLVSPVSARTKRDGTEQDDDEEIFARSGDTVVLPCNQTMPTPDPSGPFIPYLLQWVRRDLPYPFFIGFGPYPPYIDEQYNGRISVVQGLSLQIEDVRPEDDGWYECQIMILDGNYADMENGTFTHLVVIGPPRFIQTSGPVVTVKQGSTTTIQCIAKGTPTPLVTWYKNGEPMVLTDHISQTVDSVVFSGVMREDAGTYVCRAESDEGAVQETIRLLIEGAPYIFVPPHDTTVIRDQSAIFQCEAEASPRNITQRWYFNDIAVETARELEGRWEYLPEGGLMIRNVVPGDEGWYSCSPTNDIGEPPQATAFLTVQYPAYVVSMPAQIFVTRGLDTILTCDVDAKPPVDYIVWYKDGKEIAITRLSRYIQEDDGALVITSAELEDSGSFVCTPYNALGTAGESPGTTLIVRDPPVFVTRPKGLYQQLNGKDITMACSASGDPTPQITWKKVGGEIPPYRSTTTRTSLTIRGLLKSDHGIYECRATNEIATIVTSTQLIVELTSPHAPYNVTVVPHITSVHVSWQPAYNGGFSQTYTVRYRPAGGTSDDSSWTRMSNIPEEVTSMLLYDLEASTMYEFTVVATNQMGDSMYSDIKLSKTRDPYDFVSPTDETGRTLFPPYLGLIPSPPHNITLTATKEGLVLSWAAPTQFSHLVEHYAVEYRIDGPWLVLDDQISADQRKLVLLGLQPNTTYQFRVFAFTPAAFSDPSKVITENVGDISTLVPKPTGAEFGGPPGIVAGIIAGLCFLLLALMLSIIAICVSYRRRKKKRLVFFNVTSQTPQKLIIHSPTPKSKSTANPLRSGLAKLKIKLSPKHKHKSPHPSARRGLYHVNNNSNHNSPNGKIPNGGMERSLSDRLLSRFPGQGATYRVELDLSDTTAQMSCNGGGREQRFASEEALGIGDLGMTNVQLHERHYQIPEDTYTYAYRNTTTDAKSEADTQSETSCHASNSTQDDSDSPLKPQDTDGAGRGGDYVYYHGRMFIGGNSTDGEQTEEGEVNHRGIENAGLELEEISERRRPPLYSDLPLSRLHDTPPPKYQRDVHHYSDILNDQPQYVELQTLHHQSDTSPVRYAKDVSPVVQYTDKLRSHKKQPPPVFPRSSSLVKDHTQSAKGKASPPKLNGDTTAMQFTDDDTQRSVPRQSTSRDLWQNRSGRRNPGRFSTQTTLSTIPGSPPDAQISVDSGMESVDLSFGASDYLNRSQSRSPNRSPSRSPERTPQRAQHSFGSDKRPTSNVSPTRQSMQDKCSNYEYPQITLSGNAADVNTPKNQNSYKQKHSPGVRTTPELSPYRSPNRMTQNSPDRRLHNSPERKTQYTQGGRPNSSPERGKYREYSPTGALPSRPTSLTYSSPPSQTGHSPTRVTAHSPQRRTSPNKTGLGPSPGYSYSDTASPERHSQGQSPYNHNRTNSHNRVCLTNGSTGQSPRNSSFLGGSPQAMAERSPEMQPQQESPYSQEKLSPVWQLQDAAKFPGRRQQSPGRRQESPGRRQPSSGRRQASPARRQPSPERQGFSRSSPSGRGTQTPHSASPQAAYQISPGFRQDYQLPLEQIPVYTPDSLTGTDETSSDSPSSVTSTDSSRSSKQSLPHISWSPQVPEMLSPYSHYSGSSGYGSHIMSQNTASRISSIPNISEAPSQVETRESPPSYCAPGLYTHSEWEESQDDTEEFTHVSLETELMTALQRYYQDPPAVNVPKDINYDLQADKLASMEARCAELKKEMQNYKKQQSQTPVKQPRSMSSV